MDKPKKDFGRFLSKIVSYNLLRFAALFVPKKKNIWVFGERTGTKYNGNPKYLYWDIKKNHPEIRPVWLTADSKICEEINASGGEAYLFYSRKALYFGLVAKVYILSHGDMMDVGNYAIRNSITVNVWHGLPTKKQRNFDEIEKARFSKKGRLLNRIVNSLSFYSLNGKYDILTATSDLTVEKRKFYFPNTQNIVITGEARNQIFYQKINKKEILEKYGLGEYSEKKIVTYMPTFRDLRNSYKNLNQPVSSELDNVIIFEKSHPNEEASASRIASMHKFIKNISSINIDVQELLAVTDILITDYSSCFFDFLLTGRPVIFYPYDKEEYFKYENFLYDYEEVTPGIKAYTEEEVFAAIRTYSENPTLHAQERARVKKLFFKYDDANASERVLEAVKKII